MRQAACLPAVLIVIAGGAWVVNIENSSASGVLVTDGDTFFEGVDQLWGSLPELGVLCRCGLRTTVDVVGAFA